LLKVVVGVEAEGTPAEVAAAEEAAAVTTQENLPIKSSGRTNYVSSVARRDIHHSIVPTTRTMTTSLGQARPASQALARSSPRT